MVSMLIVFCDGIFGLSARFTGGGTIRIGSRRSRLSSADLRGGGGDGGCEGLSCGDRPRSIVVGVCGRLGILNARGDTIGEAGFTREST
jgi:hypothetical protein